MKSILVFASGSGSNFLSIINAIKSGELEAKICGLIVNKQGIGAIDHAKENSIPVYYVSEKEYSNFLEFEQNLLKVCQDLNPDVIALAGYMRKIPTSLISAFKGKILNIHPSLLPKFGGKGMFGLNVHRAVIESGEKLSGCTVHVVTDEFDDGPILAHSDRFYVLPDESAEELQKRILVEEHKLYPRVLQNFLNG